MMERAVERMAALIRDGQRPAYAARIAAHEHGLNENEIAAECARHGADVAQRLRIEAGRMTQDEARAFLREHLTPREWVRRDARQCASKVFYGTMTVNRADRNISQAFSEAAEQLDEEAWLIACHELYRLWAALPESMDPRPVRLAQVARHSFMWPLLEGCCFYRWVTRG